MWRALIDDILQLDYCQVTTTFDPRLVPQSHPRLISIPAASPTAEADLFLKLAAETDDTLLIAPELDGLLEERIQQLTGLNKGHLLSTPKATCSASDKWKFHQLATQAGLPVPKTMPVARSMELQSLSFPLVIKPRRGAGATDTQIILSTAQLESWLAQTERPEEFLAQEFIAGHPASISCIVSPSTKAISWLPAGLQLFDGLSYLGGKVGGPIARSDEIETVAKAAVSLIPGLIGYIGVDVIIPHDNQAPVMLLEINSRLTTSYLGYRELVEESLAERMLGKSDAITWTRRSEQISFSVPAANPQDSL